MTREQIMSELKNNFRIEELVCNHTLARFGPDMSWMFLDTKLLEVLYVLKYQILHVPMIINTYHSMGPIAQRGLRCNLCLVPASKTASKQIYLSAHTMGKAVDVVFPASSNMTAEKARRLIKQHSHLLPCNVRIEKNVSWLHIDVFDAGVKVYEFNG